MVTFLLKKKKKPIISNKKRFQESIVRVSRWETKEKRKDNKRKPKTVSINLQKKKSKIIFNKGGKRYKEFLTPVSSNEWVRAVGDARPTIGFVGLQCLKACKLNYSTMIGIKKKSNILKKYIQIWFRKYPSQQLTRKSTGHRMGKGKGKFSARVAIYRKGEIILEIGYLDLGVFNNYFEAIVKTLPTPVRKIKKSTEFSRLMQNGFSGIKNFKRKF